MKYFFSHNQIISVVMTTELLADKVLIYGTAVIVLEGRIIL